MKMLSTTSLKKRARKKTAPHIAQSITLALKTKAPLWNKIAQRLSAGTRSLAAVNLHEIDAHTTTGDTVIVPGKVLSSGTLTKKVRVCALGFSAAAREKMRATKSEAASLIDEIRGNPKAQGLKVLA